MDWMKINPAKKGKKNDSIYEKIANIRNIKDFDNFLNPSYEELHSPYLMKNIELASERIKEAIRNKEKILLSNDADVDGITSTTLTMRCLKKFTDKIDYIYNERSHGHGIKEQTRLDFMEKDENDINEFDISRGKLNEENLEKIKNTDLLIIIDSSSNESEACKRLLEMNENLEIIILDHHEIERENPHVLLVNPKQKGCNYPNKDLSSVAIVFKLLQIIEEDKEFSNINSWEYIDLVAVGLYSDMMKLNILENRYLILNGLRNMKNVGLVRILKGANANLYKLNGDSIGFSIAPMINGVTRLDNIKLALDILMTDDDNEAKKLRLKMDKLNKLRKEKQKEITERYLENIDDNKKIIIVTDDNSSRGFNGLVATQLVEKYKRPVVVGRLHKGKLSGSFRSFGGFNLKEFLNESCLVEEALGHAGAGGISVNEENINLLIDYVENNLPELSEKSKKIFYDLEIDVEDVVDYIQDMENINKLTGIGFPKVIVRVNNITVNSTKILGDTKETCKITTLDEIELIKFKVNENYGSELGIFDELDVVGEITMNEFYHNGIKSWIKTPQIKLIDYKLKDE